MKVGQGDLLFVCDQSSLAVHRMQDYKCLYNGYDLCHPIFPKIDLSILIPLISKSRSSSRNFLHPCEVHPQSKLETAGQQVAEIMQI